MIGAGSVVTKDVGTQELWYGNPAKFKGYVCKCGQKCDETLICQDCRMGVNSYVCLIAMLLFTGKNITYENSYNRRCRVYLQYETK